jgi:hypothetical protein
VTREQLGGPGSVGRFEIADAQDQLPRYVVTPKGESSTGTW